jgi:hypothetical protein
MSEGEYNGTLHQLFIELKMYHVSGVSNLMAPSLEEGSEVIKNTKYYDYILNVVKIRVKRKL